MPPVQSPAPTALPSRPPDAGLPPFAARAVALLAVGAVLGVAAGSLRFTYFGDELYFAAAGHRPDWGYADQPPLIPLLALLGDLVAPGSPLPARVPAWLAVGGLVVVTAALTREFGGGRRAQLLGAAAAALCPQFVGVNQQLATAAFDPLCWATALLLLVRWTRTRSDRLLLGLGAVVASALAVKMLIVVPLAAVGVAVLVAGPRPLLRRPALWIAVVAAVATAVPYLIWQARHGWPQLRMGEVTRAEVALFGDRVEFLPWALLLAGLLPGIPLLLRGGAALLASPRLRPWRWAGIAAPVTVLTLLVSGGRPYYVAGLFPLLWAAGAAAGEHAARGGRADRAWRAATSVPAVVLTALVTLWSLLPGEDGLAGVTGPGPRDRQGWVALADDVAARVAALPPDQRATTVLLTSYYWQAAALDRYGPARSLPPVYSGSRGFGYLGVPPESARTALLIGDVPGADRLCAARRPLAPHRDPGSDPLVNGEQPLAVCTVAGSWAGAWPGLQRMVWPLTDEQVASLRDR